MQGVLGDESNAGHYEEVHASLFICQKSLSY